ncbi:MAG: hypothetical protein ACUVRM_05165 [Bacillota bacterium]
MVLAIRREYLKAMHERYAKACSRAEKSRLIDEVIATLGYHRKYAIKVLKNLPAEHPKQPKRHRKQKYLEALPIIRMVWELLDYPCAERLKPMLLSTAELLASHGNIHLTEDLRVALSSISCSTLARRIKEWSSSELKPDKHLEKKHIAERKVD